MPPKVRILKEDIVSAAVSIVRKDGADALNARTVANALHCSTQPVFSNFATMEDLRLAVLEGADAIYQAYILKEIDRGEYPPYKASGMAYIRFAKEEKNLFKLLFMRDRTVEDFPVEPSLTNQMESLIKDANGLVDERARLFHLEMWAFVHGIAAMFATEFLELETELVSRMLTDAYQGLTLRYGKEAGSDGSDPH